MQARETADTAAEIEAIKVVKARYCRYLDTKDAAGWRGLFADDLVVELDMMPATGGADPMTAPPIVGADGFVSSVLETLADATTVHHVHGPEIELTSAATATGIWAMEDRLVYPGGRSLLGAGHYHETYEKVGGDWKIKTQHLTRLWVELTGDWSGAALSD
ncbi:nuclear transport factor 2 family protein [Gordonia hankookensis]|uniref:Nuclear transport factor 2 family protein n=1 Tax=Gordonia hankookensis TaxID=589403 RepID=A0ABR7WL14_9ACTN|nr:nuclear transport factor 2 family protein [Gordonia hankookensis]MBD1322592.1 nuclear transport factor 2 family protein [Gordonia hankookensis]NDZ97478.1 nuclear transport factor 2 family protein [Streptomyces sp. SID11726]NEB27051.1 nuclear transport factor 2 family protein [Streptomyces sp. SID6673]NED61878.1 nuclear transport factor 2 family protein [Streptomyces sp. SID10244]